MIVKDLIEFGLSEKEVKAYLALLSLEIAGVQEIAKSSNLNRSTTYVTLESLNKKGLVSISDDKKIRKYIATPPDAILRMAEDAAAKKERELRKIEKIIPEMKALYKGLKKKPLVKVFEGKEGLINIYEDILKSKEKVMRVYSCPSNLGPIIYDYIPKFVAQRMKKGIKMYGIHPDDKTNRELVKNIPKYGIDEYVLIPMHTSNADFAIYDNKIGYMSKENNGIGVEIESKEIADVMKLIYDLAFKEAKRISKHSKK